MPPHDSQGSKAPQDVQALRKKVLANENTAAIAKHLGVSLEAYAEWVVHFLLNPKEEPELYVVEDSDLRAMGLEPPDPDEMGRFVMEAAKIAEAAGGKTEFIPASQDKRG